MAFRWPFGKKQAAKLHAQREDLEVSMAAYGVHLAKMVEIFAPIAARIDRFPATLTGATRNAIQDRAEKDLPLLGSMLTEMQAAAPHQIMQTGHQRLLAGLQLMVAGKGRMLAATRNDADGTKQSDYQDGLDVLRQGTREAASAVKGMDSVIAAARRMIR